MYCFREEIQSRRNTVATLVSTKHWRRVLGGLRSSQPATLRLHLSPFPTVQFKLLTHLLPLPDTKKKKKRFYTWWSKLFSASPLKAVSTSIHYKCLHTVALLQLTSTPSRRRRKETKYSGGKCLYSTYRRQLDQRTMVEQLISPITKTSKIGVQTGNALHTLYAVSFFRRRP